MQVTADFEAAFKATSVTPNEAVADPEEQRVKGVPNNRDLGHMGEGGPSEELRDSVQRMLKENANLHAACAAKKTACAKRLLEVSTLRVEKVAQKKRIEEFTRRLTEALTAWERSVAEMVHTEEVMAVEANLIKKVKLLSLRVSELDGEILNGKDTVADPEIN